MSPEAAPQTDAPHREILELPPLVASQIAAGEVVERPASVVKELIDNAIDAGARRIRVELEAGGVELARVADDGAGIAPGELRMAVAPHATSKLRSPEDLDRIATMGFRGEALASIASVSRLSIRSRRRGASEAWVLEVEGGAAGEPRPDAGPQGTSVTARNLFFNAPARRKFLRTARTEQTRCADVVRDIAISHPAIGFTLVSEARTLLELPPNQGPRDRALAILGVELADQLLEVHADEQDAAGRGVTLWGLVGLPELARPTARGQRFYVNGRPITDGTIQHALQEAYRGLIDPGRRPTAVLMLEMTPEAVDVNVHPAKSEVRFRDRSMIHSVVLRAVRAALRAADLTPSHSVESMLRERARAEFGSGAIEVRPPAGGSARDFVEAFKSLGPSETQRVLREVADETGDARWSAVETPDRPTSALELPAARRADRVLQIHSSYLVTQDERGMLIIDQHALHERVMFEKLRNRLSGGPLESQPYLTPIVMRVGASRIDRLDELAPLLARLGVEAGPLGPEDLAIHAFPTFLTERRVEPARFLEELLEKAESGELPASDSDEAALHETLDMMACKAAVKAGDRLSDDEIAELIRLRQDVERSSSCPHGRPTSVRLTIADLEKLFGRRG